MDQIKCKCEITKDILLGCLLYKERLRNETGSRPVVRIGIVDEVRVELDLVVVEVEVGSVVEANIGIRIIVSIRP